MAALNLISLDLEEQLIPNCSICWDITHCLSSSCGLIGKPYSLRLVVCQTRLPPSEVEKLAEADTEDAQRQVLERFAQNLPVTNRTVTGVRYCHKCQHIKPDRAHHCSVCGECVLKMDHHCPWNELKEMSRFHILFLFFVSVMFAISLVSLFGYHCYLVLHNRSTLEAFRAPVFQAGPDKDGYSLGKYNNFQEVFGDNPKTWFLPLFTSCEEQLERSPQPSPALLVPIECPA
ncbi:Palmitoyltransferase Hip14 [Gryllus bimaculatus]|nr:Palmitoyltransferase Hip14 [Gryllus bimaculatus]